MLLASPAPTGQPLPLVPLNQVIGGFWALLITALTLSFGRCFLYMVGVVGVLCVVGSGLVCSGLVDLWRVDQRR